MHPDEAVFQVVRRSMLKAESDLENATLVLRAGPDGPMDTVSFHAQQCAEKCLKALRCFRGQEVPRNHDIELRLAPPSPTLRRLARPDAAPYLASALKSAFEIPTHVPYSLGGYALFPGEEPYAALLEPDDRIYLASAAASYSPAWLEGAVASAWHAIEALHERAMGE